MTNEQAWAAGVFEGEGSISLKTRDKTKSLRLAIGSTDEDVVRRFASAVGVGKVYGPYIRQKSLGKKPIWFWYSQKSDETYSVVNLFWDFLGVRRQSRFFELAAQDTRR